MSTSTNNLPLWLPQYLHLFNFPPHITPEILLNLEPRKYYKLEEGLFVCYIIYSGYLEELEFRFISEKSSMEHNPYGPLILWNDGDYIYKVRNKYHRLDGPAYFLRKKRKYYIENIEYPDELSYQVAVTQYKALHNLP